jgi:hypothetical protein
MERLSMERLGMERLSMEELRMERLAMERLRNSFSLKWKDSECSLAAHTCDKCVYIAKNMMKCPIWLDVHHLTPLQFHYSLSILSLSSWVKSDSESFHSEESFHS